jgi:competence protein ComEA
MDITEENMKLLSTLFLSIGLTLLPTLPISAAEDKGAVQVKQQKVNINKASVEQLTLLPGVGESKAKAIIEHRTQQGPFKSLEQLKDVKGIGEKVFSQLEGKIIL